MAIETNPVEQIYATKEHPYSELPETKEDLLWAELVNLDLSTFDQPGGKEALAKQLKRAVHEVGFFYLTHHGFSQEEVDKQFRIAREVFDLTSDEKNNFKADHANGGYNGYSGPESANFRSGLKNQNDISNIETFNFPKFTSQFEQWHADHRPEPVRKNWDTIVDFGKRMHTNILEKLFVIFALVLELEDEQYFVKRHLYEAEGEDHMRYMKYKSRGAKENEENHLYTPGHTDLGSVTLLFRQPVVGLNVLGGDGQWRYVKPLAGSITVNVADSLQILSGHYLKSSVHRVSRPPADQTQYDRIGILYFSRPSNDVKVEVVQGSPVLEAAGVYAKEAEKEKTESITVKQWVKARQQHLFSLKEQEKVRQSLLNAGASGSEQKESETVVGGIKVKYWN